MRAPAARVVPCSPINHILSSTEYPTVHLSQASLLLESSECAKIRFEPVGPTPNPLPSAAPAGTTTRPWKNSSVDPLPLQCLHTTGSPNPRPSQAAQGCGGCVFRCTLFPPHAAHSASKGRNCATKYSSPSLAGSWEAAWKCERGWNESSSACVLVPIRNGRFFGWSS